MVNIALKYGHCYENLSSKTKNQKKFIHNDVYSSYVMSDGGLFKKAMRCEF